MAGPRPHSLGNEKLLDSFFLHMMPRFGPYFCLIYMLCCKKQKTWVCMRPPDVLHPSRVLPKLNHFLGPSEARSWGDGGVDHQLGMLDGHWSILAQQLRSQNPCVW